MNKKQISIIAVIALLFLVGLYSLTPETRRVAVSVPYQEAIYETFYSGTLKDTGLSTRTWTISRATVTIKNIQVKMLGVLLNTHLRSVGECNARIILK